MRSNGKGMAKNGKKTLFRLIRTYFWFFPGTYASGAGLHFI